jgi:hypothetical protein
VQALSVKSAIPHPRIMGIIRECGGKMHMADQLWSEAATDFFEVRHHSSTTQCMPGGAVHLQIRALQASMAGTCIAQAMNPWWC